MYVDQPQSKENQSDTAFHYYLYINISENHKRCVKVKTFLILQVNKTYIITFNGLQ